MLGNISRGVPTAVPPAVFKGPAPFRPSAVRPTYSRLPISVNQAASIGSSSLTGTLQQQHAEQAYLAERTERVNTFFPGALGLDDFIARVEIALFNYDFTGQNSIAFTNVCRDELTAPLRDKLDQVFGDAFSTNGLGGVLTCGVTGLKAGMSHSPICVGSGKERFVFFNFPHIAVPHKDAPGTLSRPGRPETSSACGALIKVLGELKHEGISANALRPGVHDVLDPEYSILKQRLARRLGTEGTSEHDVLSLELVELTKVAERTLLTDLEFLIDKAVDTKKADYAVISGVQIHAWSNDYDDDSPNLEFVQPVKSYVVVNGERTELDLTAIPGLTPRQLRELASGSNHTSPASSMEVSEGLTLVLGEK